MSESMRQLEQMATMDEAIEAAFGERLASIDQHERAREVRDLIVESGLGDHDGFPVNAGYLDQDTRYMVQEIDSALRGLIAEATIALRDLHAGKLRYRDPLSVQHLHGHVADVAARSARLQTWVDASVAFLAAGEVPSE